MSINSPVLMPLWMMIVAVLGLVLVAAWLLRSLLVTRRDQSREVGDIPMAPSERGQWVERVETAARQVPGPGCPGEPRHNRAQQAPLRQHDAVGPDPLANQRHLIGPRLLVDHHPVDGWGVSG